MAKHKLPQFTSYQKWVIVILFLLQFTVVLDFMILAPLGELLSKDLGLTASQFGLVVSAYAFSAAISGFIAAGYLDQFDRKKILLFFYSGFILGTFFCGFSQDYYSILFARIITGVFGGVIGSINLTIVSDLFSHDQRGRVMGVVQMAFGLSQILGIPIGLLIANYLGWNATFLIIVGVAFLVLLLIVLKLKPIVSHLLVQSSGNPFVHIKRSLMNKRYQTGFVAIVFLATGGFMLMPFSSIYLVKNIHLTNEQLPILFMVTGIASMALMPLVGRLADKMNKFKIFAFGTILTLFTVLIYTNLSPVPMYMVMLIQVIMFSGVMSRMVPFQALNTMIPEKEDRGTYMSISSSLQQVSGGIGSVLAGIIVFQADENSPIEHFPIVGLVVCLSSLICLVLVYRMWFLVKNN